MKGGVKGKCGGIWGRRVLTTGGMEQPSQEHVAPCVEGVEWGLGTKGVPEVPVSREGNTSYWGPMRGSLLNSSGTILP